MGKKKKVNPRKDPRNRTVSRPFVRLSQCMIVKNEEKNIERALSWAKDIAFEQIVVDTGSTDRTVEVAESMGAKVYHFEWIDDFSAAKNFAIEQAKGNWIAFLDADEYFLLEDASKIISILEDPNIGGSYKVVRCPMIQLNDRGEPAGVYEHERLFRNHPQVRYIGAIHERLNMSDEIVSVSDISIMHTGYAKSVDEETHKYERNIRILRKEQEKDPDNPNTMIYIADSLQNTQRDEAEKLYRKALSSKRPILSAIKFNAYRNLISWHLEDDDKTDENMELCLMAVNQFPNNVDFAYYLGLLLNRKREFTKSWDSLKRCENLLNDDSSLKEAIYVIKNPMMLFYELTKAAQGLGDRASVMHYSTLILREDKYQNGVLMPYINTLKDAGTDDDELVSLLGKIYDYSSVKDKLFIARAAKDTGNRGVFDEVMGMITDEERAWLSGGGSEAAI